MPSEVLWMQIPDASHFCPSFLVQESKWAQTSFGQHLESSVDFCRRVVTLVCSAKKTQQSVRSVAYHGAPFDSIADPRGCLQLVGSVMGGAFLPVFLLHGLFLSPCRELSQREEVSKRRNFKGEGPWATVPCSGASAEVGKFIRARIDIPQTDVVSWRISFFRFPC